MQPEDFVFDSAATQLRMENDLLNHQVVFLENELAHTKERLAAAQDGAATAVESSDAATELAQAKKDLRWLLTRLDKPPVGWVTRRRSGFRNLWGRWMDGTDKP